MTIEDIEEIVGELTRMTSTRKFHSLRLTFDPLMTLSDLNTNLSDVDASGEFPCGNDFRPDQATLDRCLPLGRGRTVGLQVPRK